MDIEKRKNQSRNRTLLFITAAFFVGGMFGFALGGMFSMSGRPSPVYPTFLPTSREYMTPTPLEYVEVVIAIQDIPCGIMVESDMIRWTVYPAHAAPITSFRTIEDVTGKYMKVDVPREMPILSGMLVDSPDALPDYCKPE